MRIGSSDALVIAKSDDSDGFLALQLHTGVDRPNLQRQRGGTVLGANSIILYPTTLNDHTSRVGTTDKPETDGHTEAPRSTELPLPAREEDQEASTTRSGPCPGTIQERPILCEFSSEGLTGAEWHQASGNDDLANRPLSIPTLHLMSRKEVANQAVWFASCDTAFQATKCPQIPPFRIPKHILHVAQVSGLPFTAFKYLYEGEPKVSASRNRLMGDRKSLMAVLRRMEMAVFDKGENQSSSSPDCSVQEVAERGLRWLKSLEKGLADLGLEDAGASVLYQMVVDQRFATKVCSQLDRWKAAYTENANRCLLTIRDMDSLQGMEIFTKASLLLALIKRVASTPLPNVQRCIGTFKYVKLG